MAKTKDKPAIDTVESVETPAAPVVESPPASTRFRISLPHHPTAEIDAESEQLAIAAFNEQFGILQTDHQHSVTALTQGVTGNG